MLDPNVAVLHPSERLKSLSERIDAGFYFVVVLCECRQEHNAPHPLRLRPRRERPHGRCAAEQRYELPAVHSITSSARASSVGGTSRPSAFAVLRLITSRYFVGVWTGNSAGRSPRKMRSTYDAACRSCSIGSGPYEMRPPADAM